MERDRLPWRFSDKEPACQYRRLGCNPRVRKIPWSRKWQPAPIFLPGESQGPRSLAGYSPWDRKEWEATERLILSLFSRLPSHLKELLPITKRQPSRQSEDTKSKDPGATENLASFGMNTFARAIAEDKEMWYSQRAMEDGLDQG